jgi:hypothetical protein
VEHYSFHHLLVLLLLLRSPLKAAQERPPVFDSGEEIGHLVLHLLMMNQGGGNVVVVGEEVVAGFDREGNSAVASGRRDIGRFAEEGERDFGCSLLGPGEGVRDHRRCCCCCCCSFGQSWRD